MFFDFLLKQRTSSWHSIYLSVADYNLSVLESATLPNILLTWYFAQSLAVLEPAGDLEITAELLSRFVKDLSDRAIYIRCISGAWSEAFTDLLEPFQDFQRQSQLDTIFLGSETIYSPDSIHAFTQVLLKALKSAEETHGRGRALVAAKRIYFGVGGGVDEFLKVVSELGGKGTTAWEAKEGGVGRVILEVQRAGGCATQWWAFNFTLNVKQLMRIDPLPSHFNRRLRLEHEPRYCFVMGIHRPLLGSLQSRMVQSREAGLHCSL